MTSLTARVRRLLNDIAEGLREGWDADARPRWYDTSSDDRPDRARRSCRPSRPAGRAPGSTPVTTCARPEIDWAGYERTVEAVRRTQWQVSGIARTLVDAADEAEAQPAPSKRFLERYAGALEEIGAAVDHFGLRSEEEQAQVEQHIRKAIATLDQLGVEVRETPLDDPNAWPAYGALILDAQRLARELSAKKEVAAVPTDSGPIRLPWQERLRQIQEGLVPDDNAGPDPQDPPVERAGQAGVKT